MFYRISESLIAVYDDIPGGDTVNDLSLAGVSACNPVPSVFNTGFPSFGRVVSSFSEL